jgi:hypothetical protein
MWDLKGGPKSCTVVVERCQVDFAGRNRLRIKKKSDEEGERGRGGGG